jgi:cytochrome P450
MAYAPGTSSGPAVSTYRDVFEVLTNRDFLQSGHEASDDVLRDTLVNLEDQAHQRRHTIEKPLFKRHRLAIYETSVLDPAIERCIADCPVSEDGLRHVDLVLLTRRMLTQMAAAIIGLDDVTDETRTDRLQYFCDAMSRAARLKFETGDREKLRRELLADKQAFIEEFVVEPRARREQLLQRFNAGELTREELPFDLLMLLLIHEDPEWDDDLINREVILYLVGSTLTTAQAVPHAAFHITEWIRRHPEDASKVTDAEWVRRAAYESMRLHASSPNQLRKARHDIELSNGTEVPAGTDVVVFGGAANLDPEVFGDDAHEFNPYREPSDPKVRLYGHTFAAGTHRCAGEHLAAGIPSSPGKDNGTHGMVVRILTSLFEHGLETRSDDPPAEDESTTADFYASYRATLKVDSGG